MKNSKLLFIIFLLSSHCFSIFSSVHPKEFKEGCLSRMKKFFGIDAKNGFCMRRERKEKLSNNLKNVSNEQKKEIAEALLTIFKQHLARPLFVDMFLLKEGTDSDKNYKFILSELKENKKTE